MTNIDSQTEQLAGLVPFLGWSRAALEFRRKVAEMAPEGFYRPLIIGDAGVGKRTMAYVWRCVSGLGPEERPIIDLDTWGDVIPRGCIAITARSTPPGWPCFRLDTGTWGETGGAWTFPANLMQRFAITIYMPPLHGQREIDALAYLDFCIKVRFPRHQFFYRRIAADLIHSILFKNDWPANLTGLARSLRNLSYADLRDASQANLEYQPCLSCDTLRDRCPELGWFDRPGIGPGPAEGDGGTRRSTELVAWACGGEDIPADSVPDVAVRLYTRLAQVWLAEAVGREVPDAGLRLTPPPGDLGHPRPDLTAEAFLRLSEEQFAREYLLPGGAGRADGGPDEVVTILRHGLQNHPVLGTDFAALQAGLRIDPVGANLPSSRAIAVNQVARPWSTRRRTQPARPPAQDPQAVGEASAPENRFCLKDGIYHIVFRTAEGRTEGGSFPREGNLGLTYYRHLIQHPEKGFSALELAREVNRKDVPPKQRHERATAGEGYGSGTSYDPVLDKDAKRKMVERLDAIAQELEEARRKDHQGRIERLEEERKSINAELEGAIRIRKADELEDLGRQLDAVTQDLEEAKRDGDPPLVIQELETKRQDIIAKLEKIVQSHKAKNLDKAATQARDSIYKAMELARTKLIRRGLPGLALYLEAAARHKNGSWTYRPSKSSRDWLT